jgi:hypothetical protein
METDEMSIIWSREALERLNAFFLVGAPRCGTTALSDALRAHPQICFSLPKEPHYFSRLRPGWTLARILVDYLPLFFRDWPGGGATLAEGSTSYLYSDQAIDAIIRAFPKARFIVMVRNPLEMLPSYHKKLLFLLDENEPDLERAWALQTPRAWGEQVPRYCRDWRLLQYRDVGCVGARCQALLQRVDRQRVKFLLFDDFAADPLAVYRETLAFLELPDDGRTVIKRRNTGQLAKSTMVQLMIREPRIEIARMMMIRLRRSQRFKVIGQALGRMRRSNRVAVVPETLPPSLRATLADAFAEDVRVLSEIFGRDLGYWLEPPAAAPAREPAPAEALDGVLA